MQRNELIASLTDHGPSSARALDGSLSRGGEIPPPRPISSVMTEFEDVFLALPSSKRLFRHLAANAAGRAKVCQMDRRARFFDLLDMSSSRILASVSAAASKPSVNQL